MSDFSQFADRCKTFHAGSDEWQTASHDTRIASPPAETIVGFAIGPAEPTSSFRGERSVPDEADRKSIEGNFIISEPTPTVSSMPSETSDVSVEERTTGDTGTTPARSPSFRSQLILKKTKLHQPTCAAQSIKAALVATKDSLQSLGPRATGEVDYTELVRPSVLRDFTTSYSSFMDDSTPARAAELSDGVYKSMAVSFVDDLKVGVIPL